MSVDRPHALSDLSDSRAARPFVPVGTGRGRAATGFDRVCLAGLARALAGVPVRFELWDGTSREAGPGPHLATFLIHDRASLVKVTVNPDLYFGEAYMDGRIDVVGDLVGALAALSRCLELKASGRRPWRRGADVPHAVANARRHYDLGNDFYRQWLDADLVYTCAYFRSPADSLEVAQKAKLDYVARKLRLQPGDRVFEAGSGWGALALHLARDYGVSVRAWNVSRQQTEWARTRARDEGLADRVEFIEGDYRSIRGICDAFVSVGMLEHVGPSQYGMLGDVIERTAHPDHGRGLLHFIGRNAPSPTSAWTLKYIFPGSYLPSLAEALEGVFEGRRFSVHDVENLRPHYTRTLAHWLDRFERVAPLVTREHGERFTRMWRFYLAGAQAGFQGGSLQLFQIVFARRYDDVVPWTRDDLYQSPSRS